MTETKTRPRTISANIRDLIRRVENLEDENQRLRDELALQAKRAREWDADEQEYTQDIIKLENQLALAKSLVNIPDNIAGPSVRSPNRSAPPGSTPRTRRSYTGTKASRSGFSG